MKIDTSSIISGGSSKLLNKAGVTVPVGITELLSDLKLSIGQKVEASVSNISLITAEERSLLFKLHTQEPISPEIKAKWAKLLNSSGLKHIELILNQKLIHTLTAAPLIKGQLVKVELTNSGLELVLDNKALLPSKAEGANTPPKLNPQMHYDHLGKPKLERPSQLGRPSTEPLKIIKQDHSTKQGLLSLLKQTASPRMQPLMTPKDTTGLLVKESLSKALPHAEKHNKLFTTFEKLTKAVAPLGSDNKQVKALVQALNTQIEKHNIKIDSTTFDRISTPSSKAVREAIQRSGIFYEHQSLQKSDIVERDLKGSLIQLSQWLDQAQSTTLLPSKITAKDDALVKLWLNILQPAHTKSLPQTRQLPSQTLYQSIQQLVQHSIARIQVQQCRSINGQSKELASVQNTYHLDIPVRTPDGYSTIYMQLFEPRLREDEKRKKQSKSVLKKAKWRVYMEMELDDEGLFAVELSVSDKKMGATFWAESESLRGKAESHIHQLKQDLEAKGLEVTDLRCSKNMPPKQDIQMDFSLIDIRT